MNAYFLAAGALCLVTVAFHCIAGGVRVVRPMLASRDLNDTMKAVLYGCWHTFTWLYMGVAAMFLYAAFRPEGMPLGGFAAVMALGLSALSVIVIMRFGQRFRRLPHWLLFLLAGVLGMMGVWS